MPAHAAENAREGGGGGGGGGGRGKEEGGGGGSGHGAEENGGALLRPAIAGGRAADVPIGGPSRSPAPTRESRPCVPPTTI